jgi:GT2 family glycosyltransferase
VIVAVVLTFAAPDGMLEACVDSLLAADGLDRIVVVDNGRTASSRLDGRDVEQIVTAENLGYAGGMNVGIRRALEHGADAVLVLNDDVVVAADVVAPLVAALASDDRLGAAQPKLLFPGADPVRINSLGVRLGRDGAGVDIGIGEIDGPGYDDERDIEAFTGGAVLLRADFLREVGLFDERFFLYYEDVDLALSGAERGWRYRCIPASRVVHEGGVTALHETARARTVYLRERNRLWVLVRYRGPGDVARGFWLSVRRLRWSPRRTHVKALAAGLAAIPRLRAARRRARRLRTR